MRCSNCGEWNVKSEGLKCLNPKCNSLNICLYDSCQGHELCDAMNAMTKEIKWLQDKLKEKS